MKIKTNELEGAALDWAVAVATGYEDHVYTDGGGELRHGVLAYRWAPSSDWSQGGPLIADGVYMLCRQNPLSPIPFETEGWIAAHEGLPFLFDGPTPLIAACRAIVAAKLGDEIDVPEELV